MLSLSNDPAADNNQVKATDEAELVPDYSATDNIRAKNRKFFYAVLCVALVFTALRMLLVRFCTDPKTGFYDANTSGFFPAFDYIVALAVIAIFASRYFFYKNKSRGIQYAEIYAEGSQSIVFTSVMLAFLLISAAALEAFALLSDFNALKLPLGSLWDFISKNAVFDFLSIIAAVPSAVYFFKMAAKPQNYSDGLDGASINDGKFFAGDDDEISSAKDEKPVAKSGGGYLFLSLFPIFWTYCRLLSCFFDMKSPINSTSRMYEISALVALMLFLVSQSRLIAGNRFTRAFMTFGYIAMILLFMSGLPSLVFSTFWYLEIRHLSIYYAVYLAMGLNIISHMHSQIDYSRYGYLPEPKA